MTFKDFDEEVSAWLSRVEDKYGVDAAAYCSIILILSTLLFGVFLLFVWVSITWKYVFPALLPVVPAIYMMWKVRKDES